MIKFLNKQSQKVSAMILTGAMIASGDAFATNSTDLSSLTQKVGDQSSNIPQFINYACYITGVGLVGMGLFGFKKHVDSGGQEKLPPALVKTFVGGALVATPTMIDIATGTGGLDGGTATFDGISTTGPFGAS
jgi:hypothetical protein